MYMYTYKLYYKWMLDFAAADHTSLAAMRHTPL